MFDEEKFFMNPLTVLLLPTDKLSDFLLNQSDLKEKKMFERKRGKNNKKFGKTSEINSVISLKMYNGEKFTQFDKAIILALVAEQQAGNNIISLTRLFQTLGGGNHLHENLKAKILKSIHKMRHSDFKIDMTDYVKNFGKDNKRVSSKSQYLLPAEITTVKVNGKITDGAIKLLKSIPLFKIADVKNQIARQPAEFIAGLPVRATENTITLSWYLLERLTEIIGSNAPERKHTKKLNTAISLETLALDCGFSDFDRVKRHRLLQKIEEILAYWRGLGVISAFEIDKNGGKNAAIRLTLSDNSIKPLENQET